MSDSEKIVRLRAVANGNEVQMTAREAQPLVDAGIFTLIEEENIKTKDEVAKDPEQKAEKGTYDRKDMVSKKAGK